MLRMVYDCNVLQTKLNKTAKHFLHYYLRMTIQMCSGQDKSKNTKPRFSLNKRTDHSETHDANCHTQTI